MTATASDLSSQLDSARTPKLVSAREKRRYNDRREAARRNLVAFATEHERPEEWLGEMLDMLGLRPADDLEVTP